MEAVSKAREIERLLAESEWITGLAARLVGDVHGAEDLAQETHLAALERTFKDGASPRPWLATVARNGARMMRRSRAARLARETDRAREAAEEMGSSPEELLANLESQELVSRLVRELPAELSDVILLSFHEGLSSEGIARLRGIPAGTVRWRKKQALELLRERLDAHHDGDRTRWLAALAPLTTNRWRTAAKVASGGAGTGGLFATWIAMSITWKLVSLVALIALFAMPFVAGSDAQQPSSQQKTEEAVAALPPPTTNTRELPATAKVEQQRVVAAPTDVPQATDGGQPTTRVRLRVVDAAGRAVRGVAVTPSLSYEMERAHREVFAELNPLELAALQTQLVQTTGADGTVAWETNLLRENGLVDFDAAGPNLEVGHLSAVLEAGQDVQLEDLILRRAGSVEGHVRFSDDRSAQRLLVLLRAGTAPNSDDAEVFARWQTELFPGGAHSTRVQRDGSYRLTGVMPGEYYVQVNPLDGTPQVATASFQVAEQNITGGIDVWIEVPTNGPPQILVLGADGKPLRGAQLQLDGSQFKESGSVNRDGLWRFLFNSYGKFAGGRVEVSDPSLVHRSQVLDPLPMEGQRIVIQLELARTRERTLHLVGTNGESVGAASIEVTTPSGTRSWEAANDGATLLLPDEPGEAFDLTVKARGFQPRTAEQLVSASLADEWTLQLDALPGIRGHVMAEGAPLAKARVALRGKWSGGRVSVAGNEVQRLGGVVDETTTDETGAFLLFHSGAGEFVVEVKARRFASAALDLGARTGEETSAPIEITLDKGGEVRGTVLDRNGQPLPGATLVLAHPYLKLQRKRAGRDGTFRFRKVPAGGWFLRAVSEFREPYISRIVDVADGWSFPVNCVVRPGAETLLDVHASDPASSSISGDWSVADGEWTIQISCGGWATQAADPFVEEWEHEAVVRAGDAFEVALQAGREYRVVISSALLGGYLRRDVRADQLPLRMDLGFQFAELEAVPAGWTPAAGFDGKLNMSWESGEWMFHQSLEPEADGRYASTMVPAGELHLSWRNAETEEWGSRDVELGRGEQRQVHLK